MTSKELKDKTKKLAKLILNKSEEGKIIFFLIEGLVETTPEKLCEQDASGLLWDLNRDEVTCIRLIEEGEQTWINNFATAKVIRYLHGEVERLRKELAER